MANKNWLKAFYNDKLKHGNQAVYWQTSRSALSPHDGRKQRTKSWNNHTSRTGHVTIGKSPSRYY